MPTPPVVQAPSAAKTVLHQRSGPFEPPPSWTDDPICFRTLDLGGVKGTINLMDAIAAALDFPPYFGRNWGALDECLGELEWLSYGTFVLVIEHVTSSALTDREVRLLIETIQGTADGWDTEDSLEWENRVEFDENAGERRMALVFVGDLTRQVRRAIKRAGLALEELSAP